MQLERCRRKGCKILIVRIEYLREHVDTTYGDEYIFEDREIRDKLRESFEEKYPNLKKLQYLFLQELTRLPLSRVFDFSIALVPRVEPISRAPYQMTTTKLMEL